MELRSLKHVVALARTLSYVRASEQIGLSQSALTRSIQSIERQLGVKLFDRDRGGVRMTRHGLEFAERAKLLLTQADDMLSLVQRAASAEDGYLPFGMEPMPARALLPATLAAAIQSAPNMRNHVLIRSIEALWELLKTGEIDFFISAGIRLPEAPAVRAALLGTFPLSFLVRADHPALRNEDDMGPYPVLLAGEAGTFGPLPARLTSLISGPRHIIEDYDILAKLLDSTDAILVSSPFAVQEEIASGSIRELPFRHDGNSGMMPIVMYSLERRSLSPAARKLQARFEALMRSITSPE